MNEKTNDLRHDEDIKDLTSNDDIEIVEEIPENNLMLTTIDNPYNPKTDYAKWRTWDYDNGYHTEEFLARFTDIPDDVDMDDELEISRLTNKAIQELLEHDVIGVYTLV